MWRGGYKAVFVLFVLVCGIGSIGAKKPRLRRLDSSIKTHIIAGCVAVGAIVVIALGVEGFRRVRKGARVAPVVEVDPRNKLKLGSKRGIEIAFGASSRSVPSGQSQPPSRRTISNQSLP